MKRDVDQIEDFQVDESNLEISERASRLKAAVKRAGGNQVVSNRSGIPISTLNNYIAGRDMKASSMVALAKACDVNVAWLATGEEPMAGSNSITFTRAPYGPQKPMKAFANIKMDLITSAFDEAQAKFEEAGAVPTSRELMQVTLLIYDTLNKP